MFHKLRYEGTFTPPSLQGTLVFPGNLGMFEWGGIAVDTDRQIAVANPIALPFVSRLIPRGPGNPLEPEPGAKGSGTESGIQPQYGIPYGVTINPFLSPLGLPCKQPAWGYISAIDLKTNEIVWKKRIGTVRDSSPIPLPFKMGMPMLGGPIVTAGGVAFIGATADNYIRAFNVNNGEQALGGPPARRRSGHADELFDQRPSVRRDRGGRAWLVRHKARRLCDCLCVAAAVSGTRCACRFSHGLSIVPG